MRKVIFKINDIEYFFQKYKDDMTSDGLTDLLESINPFRAVYTLIGEGKNVDRYELTDYNGNKIKIDDLNGYQRGVVLNDCMAYFTGGKYFENDTQPCGVIEITEEDI